MAARRIKRVLDMRNRLSVYNLWTVEPILVRVISAVVALFIVALSTSSNAQKEQGQYVSGHCTAKALWEGSGADGGGVAAYRGCDQEEPPTYLSFQCRPGRSQLTVTSEVVFPRKPDGAVIPFTISVGSDRHVFRAKVDNSGMYESLSFEMSTDHPVIEQLALGSEATLSATGKPLNIHLKGARQAIEVMRHTCGAPARPAASMPTPSAQQAYLDLRPLVDEITGMEIGVPADMPGTIDRATHGLNWKSADGSFNIDLLRFARDRSLRSIYDKLKGIAGRQITRDEYSERSFVLEGIDGGKAHFIVRVQQKGEEKRGLSVVHSLRGGSAHADQARRIADTLRAFPDGTASESRAIASAGETRRIDIFGAPATARSFASPSRFNPPNAESVCREEYHALQSAAQRVRLAFPDRRSFQMGETFTISWTAPDWPKVSGERQILLQFDLPLEADLPELGRSEIKSGYDSVYHWTSNQNDKSGSEYLYPEGRVWKRFSVLLNAKDGDPSGKLFLHIRKAGNFTVSAHVAMTPAYSLSQARADCVNAKLTTSAVMPLSIAPMPPRFAQPKACHLSLSRAADLAAKIRLDRPITDGNVTIQVGQPLGLTWQRTERLDPTCITPLYLVLSFPEEVRLAGDGFLALMPGAAGPFGISHDINKIRAIIPLHVLGAFKDVQVMSFRAGTATVEAALVEVPALREAPIDATDFSGENAVVRLLPEKRFKWDIQPAAPKVVVQDAFDTTQPLSVSTTPDGRYQLQVFKAHYRVVDTMNGALIVQRAGTQPEFSITGRFVASLLEDRHSPEIVDLISATPIAYMRSEEQGTYIGRGVQPIAWGSNDSFVLYAPNRGPGFIKSTLIERDPVEFISDGSKHANVTPMIIKVDLEQLAVAYQKNPGSASHSPSWSSLLGKSDGPKADFSPRYGTLTQTWPAFTHDLYRWVLGGATRFALFPEPPDLQALLSAGKSMKFHDEKTRSQWLQSTKQSFESQARDYAFFDRHRIPRATTPHPRKSPQTETLTERLVQVRSVVRSLDLSGEAKQSSTSVARLMNLTNIVLRPNVVKIGTAGAMIDSVDAPSASDNSPPDPHLVEAMLEHANSPHYQNLMIKHEGREHKRRQFKRLQDVPVDFACEYDTPDGSFGKFISPGRIMGRTAFKSKDTRMWLIQQDCWGGSGWRSVQLGLLVKKPDAVPEYHDLIGERLKVDENFGLNSGKLARGWVTVDHVLLLAMPNRAVAAYDINARRRIVNLRNVEGAEFSAEMRLSEDRTLLAMVSEGGRVEMFQTRFSEKLLSGVETDDELILYDDNGYYLSTPEGAHFVNVKFPGIAGYNTVHQFAKTLNRPDIIKDILAGKPAPPKPDLTPPPVLSVRAEVQSAAGTRAARLAYETTSTTGLTSLRVNGAAFVVLAAARSAAISSSVAAVRKVNRGRGHLPAHLPREEVVIEPSDTTCPCCGGDLHVIG